MLNVNELQKEHKIKKNKLKCMVKAVLEDCYKRIKKRNDIGCTAMKYTLPAIQLGFPLLDPVVCMKYIKKKLEKGEFKVLQLTENTLIVDLSR